MEHKLKIGDLVIALGHDKKTGETVGFTWESYMKNKDNPRYLIECPFIADGEVFSLREFYEEQFGEEFLETHNIPEDRYGVSVWLILNRTGEVVDAWEELRGLSFERANRLLKEVLEDMGKECDFEGWFNMAEIESYMRNLSSD